MTGRQLGTDPRLVDWHDAAQCQGDYTDDLFASGARQNEAKRLCRGCPVQRECLAEALDNRISYGVWGAFTERERRALLRRYQDVPDWRAVLVDGVLR